MPNKLLLKLVRLQITPWQFAGFALANVLGLTVVLFGVQFYTDSAPVFTANDSFMKEEYIVVTKEVGLSGLTGRGTPHFSPAEVEEVSSQPFIDGCAPFVSADFSVIASVSSAATGMGFQTEMFLEALPDEYIDISMKQWGYSPGATQVPIVIPRNYLNLYNFGFAAGRGLPAVSETMIGMVPINLYLTGEKGSMKVEGRVTAFSNRLNTILVPMAFMRYANDSLAYPKDHQAARLCLDVKNPADPAIGEFLSAHGYRTEGTGGDAGRMAFFLRLISFAVVGIGLCICVLAFFVMLLSVFLLLQKNMEKAQTLLLIGYPSLAVCAPYFALIAAVYAVGLIVAAVAVGQIRETYIHHFAALNPDFTSATGSGAGVAGLTLSVLLATIAAIAVWRKVKSGR
ncbi:MAG: ABC transporter permease [Bacteroidaceae bacterium]|nr:ABC transporter permease [Bacteroidaceae bacterium]